MPGNDKVVLNVSGDNRRPAHGNIAGFMPAQSFSRTVVFKGKTVKRRFGQLNGNNADGSFGVGTKSQNIFGIGSEHDLPHLNRVRRCGYRRFAVINYPELNIIRRTGIIGNVQRIIVVRKHRLGIILLNRAALHQKHHPDYENYKRSKTNHKNNAVGFLHITFGMG